MKYQAFCLIGLLAIPGLFCGKPSSTSNSQITKPSDPNAEEMLQGILLNTKDPKLGDKLRALSSADRQYISNQIVQELLLDLQGKKKIPLAQKQGYSGFLMILGWKADPHALLPILNNESEDLMMRAFILDYIGTANDPSMKAVVREYVKRPELQLAQFAACACWELNDKPCAAIIRERMKKLNLPREQVAEKVMGKYVNYLESGFLYKRTSETWTPPGVE